MTGTIRYFDTKSKKTIIDRLKDVCKSKEMKWKTQISFSFKDVVEPLCNSKEIYEEVYTQIINNISKDNIVTDYRTMAVDDFAEYLKYYKGMYFLIGCKEEVYYPQHHPKFNVGVNAMLEGFKVLLSIL